MSDITNIASKIEEHLPAELTIFIRTAGEVAQDQGQKLYLVGGVVRDLILGQSNFDLDLVIEGDAIGLARRLVGVKQAEITVHTRFGTANLHWDTWSVDLATARSEIYPRPGALPKVKPGSIKDDLFRRDFTVNAMAVQLNAAHYGTLIDLYGGRHDLEHKLIRIMHEKSFTDDATRIWRALRYEQRLDFQIEKRTLELLKRDVPMLDTISGDRIRYELECIFREEHPEKVLRRAGELKLSQKVHPELKGNGWLAAKFEQARQQALPNPPSFGVYLAILAYRLTQEQGERLISYLRLPRAAARTVRDTIALRRSLNILTDPSLSPSVIYRALHGYYPPAVTVNSLACDSDAAQTHIALYMARLSHVKPTLNGNDLMRIGMKPGPRIKEALQTLLEARLDGKVTSKQQEERLVRKLLD